MYLKWGKRQAFSPVSWSCSSTIYWKDTSFSIELIWNLNWNFNDICMNLVLDSVTSSIDLSILMSKAYYLFGFFISLQIICNYSNFVVFFFKMFFKNSNFLHFHVNFRSNLFFHLKKMIGILIRIILKL